MLPSRGRVFSNDADNRSPSAPLRRLLWGSAPRCRRGASASDAPSGRSNLAQPERARALKASPASRALLQPRPHLDEIVRRRNQIVHEGDYERKERPRKAKTTPLSESQARADIDFIARLVYAIHSVI